MEAKGIVAASSPQWISVKDRLPDNYVYVLVCGKDGMVFIDYHNGHDWGGYKRVTHWMPLPAPPKAGE